MRFLQDEQRILHLHRSDLLSPYLKLSLKRLSHFDVMQLCIVMELLCTHKLSKFVPGIYVYFASK